MIDAIEILLALYCWAIGLLIFFYILPRIRHSHPWHVQGLNILGAFVGYLGFEIVADTRWLDDNYEFYLLGNSLFPIAATVIMWGYLRRK
jgi:mannose/fructose/N-acetylgalactosamine-specific phosphotransferase system component IIC